MKWFKKKEIDKPIKGDFVIVLHNWFGVQSNGFDQVILKGVTKEEVTSEAYRLVGKNSSTFNHVGFTIVEWKESNE